MLKWAAPRVQPVPNVLLERLTRIKGQKLQKTVRIVRQAKTHPPPGQLHVTVSFNMVPVADLSARGPYYDRLQLVSL